MKRNALITILTVSMLMTACSPSAKDTERTEDEDRDSTVITSSESTEDETEEETEAETSAEDEQAASENTGSSNGDISEAEAPGRNDGATVRLPSSLLDDDGKPLALDFTLEGDEYDESAPIVTPDYYEDEDLRALAEEYSSIGSINDLALCLYSCNGIMASITEGYDYYVPCQGFQVFSDEPAEGYVTEYYTVYKVNDHIVDLTIDPSEAQETDYGLHVDLRETEWGNEEELDYYENSSIIVLHGLVPYYENAVG